MTSRFEAELNKQTTRRPNGNAGRIYAGTVILRVNYLKNAFARIGLIKTMPLFRGCGNGSKALDFLCDLADETETTLILSPVPLDIQDSRTLGTLKLVDWYKRRGFVEVGQGDMVRYPTGATCHSHGR